MAKCIECKYYISDEFCEPYQEDEYDFEIDGVYSEHNCPHWKDSKKMKYKIGDTVEIFQTKEKCKVVNIVEGVQADIYGTMINAYELEGRKKFYVDIYDSTVGSI